MFTGIIETTASLVNRQKSGSNTDLYFSSPIKGSLKVDQSVAHNGVCLTVVEVLADSYRVTAIDETLKRSNIGDLKTGDTVNIERCMPADGRFDGHIVQGHVDTTAICTQVKALDGSWVFSFRYPKAPGRVTVEKGSITVNGVSLTVVDSADDCFSVHLIPYTFENTNFKTLRKNDRVNLEFDIIGKYVARLLQKDR